jgi:hypothetical protein
MSNESLLILWSASVEIHQHVIASGEVCHVARLAKLVCDVNGRFNASNRNDAITVLRKGIGYELSCLAFTLSLNYRCQLLLFGFHNNKFRSLGFLLRNLLLFTVEAV